MCGYVCVGKVCVFVCMCVSYPFHPQIPSPASRRVPPSPIVGGQGYVPGSEYLSCLIAVKLGTGEKRKKKSYFIHSLNFVSFRCVPFRCVSFRSLRAPKREIEEDINTNREGRTEIARGHVNKSVRKDPQLPSPPSFGPDEPQVLRAQECQKSNAACSPAECRGRRTYITK